MTFQGMRVALVGPLPPPSGGMANQTRQLGELLRGEGAHVEIVQTNAPYRPAWTSSVRGLRALARLLPYLASLWRATGRSHVVHVMANSGWSWHLFAAPAIWIGWMRRRPVVVNYRGGEAEPFLAKSAALVKFTLSRAAQLVVPSRFLEQVFGRFGVVALVVPNIVDLQRFRPDIAGGPHAPPDVIVARNLEPIYDNATALRAFARVLQHTPEARLTIAGTGPEESALRELAARLGIEARVRFSGRLESDAMARDLRRSRVALNPSLVDNMPNSVLEALASGVPLVSTRVGGVPYIVDDGETALLVGAGDDAAMAEALSKILSDDVLAARLARNGLQVVQPYAWPNVRAQWLRVYRRAIDGAGPADAGQPDTMPSSDRAAEP
jgi:glycosyltransferase involved in cell wall biosynthesis